MIESMKKFYTLMTQQDMKESWYGDMDSKEFVMFPILGILKRYVDKEMFKLIVVDGFQSERSKYNVGLLKNELERLFPEHCLLMIVDIPMNKDKREVVMFDKLCQTLEKEDEIYFDMTFGYKPTSMLVMLMCNYAERFIENVRIKKIMYAQYHFDKKDDTEFVHDLIDVTNLYYLNQMIYKVDQDVSLFFNEIIDEK